MRARHSITSACVALLILAASAGADELGPPEPPAPTATATATPAEPPAPIPTAVPEATSAATPPPKPTAVVEETPAVEATPAPTPPAVFESAAAAEATPARAVRVAVAAQEPPPPPPEPTPPAPGGCATPVEPLDGVEEAPAADGQCRVLAAVCSILGTDGDDVLTGSPFDDIICGLGGNDRLDGGDGDDVLLGGEGDDGLVGGEGDDCMVGGPGSDRAENTEEEFPEVEQSANIDPYGGLIEQYAHGITFDAAGRCTGVGSYTWVGGGKAAVPRVVAPTVAPPAGAVAASSSASGGLRLGLPDRRLAVRDGVVRVPVSCSAEVGAELVLLAGSRRIAHKRFTCTPPDEKVRMHLNDAGRKLVADDDPVQARVLVLAGGRTVSRQVLLVSPGG